MDVASTEGDPPSPSRAETAAGEPNSPHEMEAADESQAGLSTAATPAADRQCSRSCAGDDGSRSAGGEDACDLEDSRSCACPPDASEASNCQESEVADGAPAEDAAADAPMGTAAPSSSAASAASSEGAANATVKRRVTAKATGSSSALKKRRQTVNSPVIPGKGIPPPPPFMEAPGGANPSFASGHGSEEQAEPSELDTLRRELETLREQYGQQRRKLNMSTRAANEGKQALAEILKRLAQREFSEENDRVQAATFRFGHCRQTHMGIGLNQNVWSGGYDEEDINRLRARIEDDRQNITRERATLKKSDADDQFERREVLSHRSSYLNKEESILKDRGERLVVDRQLHLKRQQRLEAARRSNFGDFPKMKDKYQLLNMIGRGGFSEVYRAFDLETNSYCAVKIHELGKDMSEAQRQNYIRRAMREYEIQKGLKHPKVVTLQDCFPISNKAFGTVLELCNGDTLDEYMKRHGLLPEREARGIIIQVLSGLRYLNVNETGNKIIHYDLKPGNLFFQCGEVKIADFGLSKIVHQNNPGESIDLTSQGAGTYWYLPPECMVMEVNTGEAPKISNKVDVWSTGVIFFELLFGKRPYGHGQSQEAFRRAAVANSAFDGVEVPKTPKVTSECERYLKRLLALDKDHRPDVIEALADVYIRGPPKPGQKPRPTSEAGGNAAGSSGNGAVADAGEA